MALVQPPRLVCSSTRLPSPEGFNVTVLLSQTWRGKVNIWRIIFAPVDIQQRMQVRAC